MLRGMQAVFQLVPQAREVPSALADSLAALGFRALPLDASSPGGPLAGWYQIEGSDPGRLGAAVDMLQTSDQVAAAYLKPKEGPPA